MMDGSTLLHSPRRMLRPLSGPFGERGRDMQRRLLDSFGVAMALAAVVVVFRLAAVPAMGQTTGTTAWGHLDLAGIWLDVYDTPRAGARSWAIESSRPLKRDLPAMRRARPTSARNRRRPRGSPAGRVRSVQHRVQLGEAGGSARMERQRTTNDSETSDSRCVEPTPVAWLP